MTLAPTGGLFIRAFPRYRRRCDSDEAVTNRRGNATACSRPASWQGWQRRCSDWPAPPGFHLRFGWLLAATAKGSGKERRCRLKGTYRQRRILVQEVPDAGVGTSLGSPRFWTADAPSMAIGCAELIIPLPVTGVACPVTGAGGSIGAATVVG